MPPKKDVPRSERQRAKAAKIEAKRSRGTLLPMDVPVEENVQIGEDDGKLHHSDKNRLK